MNGSIARCAMSLWLAAAVVVCGYSTAGGYEPIPGVVDSAVSSIWDTEEVLVFLEPGQDITAFAQEHGLAVRRALRSDPNAYVLEADTPARARAVVSDMRQRAAKLGPGGRSRVRAVYVNQRVPRVRMAFVPNDPYFHKDTPLIGWPGQWHLINEHTPGLDARVQGAWNRDVTGAGVIIGIVDDCIQTDHPDLSANYVSADSWDFGQNDPYPNPVYTDDQHGISVAGVAAARGGNAVGVTGAAPHAGLAGLRCDFYYGTTASFVDATQYHSSGSNTNIKVKNHSYGIPISFIETAAEEAALETSTLAGTIHCVAAGNSWWDANLNDLQNSPHAICVAALASDGKYAHYSNYGACVFVTCPSSDDDAFGITTTDRTTESRGYNGEEDAFPDPSYTSIFGGTSSASPLAAGVLALAKQVQPNLDTRFAKHLLVRTSDIVDPADASYRSAGGWGTNAAGLHFNHNYGFGLIDADELTQQAAEYTGVTPAATEDTGYKYVNVIIPENDAAGISRTFVVDSGVPVEVIELHLKLEMPTWTSLEAYLTSPSGTRGRVVPTTGPGYAGTLDWTFTTNEFWGENPAGVWTLTISDLSDDVQATWYFYRVITHHGTLLSDGLPGFTLHPVSRDIDPGATATFSVQATGATPLSYQWQKDGDDLSDDGQISGATTNTLQITNCQVSDLGMYGCVVTNSHGQATSDEAALGVGTQFIVESRSGGLNYDHYSETGTFSDSSGKSCAPVTTIGVGSRWASMDVATHGINRAVYSYTPPIDGIYEVFVTWPSTSNTSEAVEHQVTHAAGSTSVMLDQNNVSNPGGPDNWNSLGQYGLQAGETYTVTQTNEQYPDPGSIFRADAVKWELVVPCLSAPTVTAIQPDSGRNDEIIQGVLVTGSNFLSGQTSLRLIAPGEPDIEAANVTVAGDGTSLTCDLDLNGAVAGPRDVIAEVPGCPAGALVGGFTITPAPCDGPPVIYSIEPDAGRNDQLIEDALVRGVNFTPGQTTVSLTRAGQPDIVATDVVVAGDGLSLTCDLDLRWVAAGAWSVVVSKPNCPPAVLEDRFTIYQAPAAVPIDFSEAWDSYATGYEDPTYVARWPLASSIAAARYEVQAAEATSSPNSLKVRKLVSTGIIHDLAPELEAAVPDAIEVLGSDESPLELLYRTYMRSGAVEQADLFVELSKGEVHAPLTNSSTVLPVIAFGMTAGINGVRDRPYFFDGQSWHQVYEIRASDNYNDFYMKVRTEQVDLEGRNRATGSTTLSRAYLGGFDRVTIRTYSNDGTSRAFDDILLYGGSVFALPPLVPGDFDRDGDVDIDDYQVLDGCYSGPTVPYEGDCGAADLDTDNDVDQSDFGIFQRCYSGQNHPANPDCAD